MLTLAIFEAAFLSFGKWMWRRCTAPTASIPARSASHAGAALPHQRQLIGLGIDQRHSPGQMSEG